MKRPEISERVRDVYFRNPVQAITHYGRCKNAFPKGFLIRIIMPFSRYYAF